MDLIRAFYRVRTQIKVLIEVQAIRTYQFHHRMVQIMMKILQHMWSKSIEVTNHLNIFLYLKTPPLNKLLC